MTASSDDERSMPVTTTRARLLLAAVLVAASAWTPLATAQPKPPARGAQPSAEPESAPEDAEPSEPTAETEEPAADTEPAADESETREPTADEVERRVDQEEGALGTLTEPGVVTVEEIQAAKQEAETDEEDEGAQLDAEAEAEPAADDAQASDHGGALGDLAEPSTTKPPPMPHSDRRTRLGPASIVLNDQGDRITFGFAGQLRVEGARTLESGSVARGERGVGFRRLRTVLSSSFMQGRVRSSFQLNITPDAFELIDAWGLYAPLEKLALRLGQFKIPFTRYRAQSFAALSRTDWSPVTKMFGSERQIGLEMLNPNPDDSSLEFSFGVFTGANARASHAIGMTKAYGEQPPNPSDLRAGDGNLTQFQPALVGRVARNFGAIDTGANTDLVGGPLRHSLGLGAAGQLQPVERRDLTLRLSLEWLAKFHGTYLNATAYVGWFPEVYGGTRFGPWGLMCETGYRFDRTWELAASFTQVGQSDALRDDARAYGQAQLADPDLSDAQRQAYAAAGQARTENELVVTGNAYIVGHSSKVQLEGGWRRVKGEGAPQDELVGRLQFQLHF